MEPVYYSDHDERYAYLGPEERKEYPDEVKFPSGKVIRREKKLEDMTAEDYKRYGGMQGVRVAAIDMPLYKAIPKEWK